MLIDSLNFWRFAAEFYETRNYLGSLSVLHRIDCTSTIQFYANFPGAGCSYRATDAITFGEREYGIANGSSRVVKELESFGVEAQNELVLEFTLAHLRQLCGASVDYDKLKEAVGKLPDRFCGPYF